MSTQRQRRKILFSVENLSGEAMKDVTVLAPAAMMGQEDFGNKNIKFGSPKPYHSFLYLLEDIMNFPGGFNKMTVTGLKEEELSEFSIRVHNRDSNGTVFGFDLKADGSIEFFWHKFDEEESRKQSKWKVPCSFKDGDFVFDLSKESMPEGTDVSFHTDMMSLVRISSFPSNRALFFTIE